jgi:hypothetical protein
VAAYKVAPTSLMQPSYYKNTTKMLKGQCHEFFASGFFLESVSPKPLIIPLRSFRIFLKIRGDIGAQGLPPVSTTPVANGKNLQAEKFK